MHTYSLSLSLSQKNRANPFQIYALEQILKPSKPGFMLKIRKILVNFFYTNVTMGLLFSYR
jgi:hypothetical protein